MDRSVTELMNELGRLMENEDLSGISRLMMSVAKDDSNIFPESVHRGLTALLWHMQQIGMISTTNVEATYGGLAIVFALGRLYGAEAQCESPSGGFQSYSNFETG